MVRSASGWSRRRFLGGTGAGLGCAALSQWPLTARAAVDWTELTRDLTLLTGAGGNMLALETDAGWVMVDSGRRGETGEIAATLFQWGDNPIAAVFNTHWHPDQVGGNADFGGAGAVIHAQVKTRQRLQHGYFLPQEDRYQAALPPAGVPTESFYRNAEYRIGDSAIECAYLIEAHTDGDIAVMFPEQNVIAVGGVIAPGQDPEFDWFGGGWLGGRIDSYELLLAHSDTATRFVPARGEAFGQAELRAELDMCVALFERMVEQVRLGHTPRDMLEAGVFEGLGREFGDPDKLIYDLNKGFWGNQNKLTHDIV